MDALTLIYFILGLSLLILVHEFGHFIWAKIFNVYVYEFSLFMGPKLFQFKGKETKYSLRLLPIGGYCSLAGEEDSQSSRNEKERLEVNIKNQEPTLDDYEKSVINHVDVNNIVNERKIEQLSKLEELPDVPKERSLLGITWWKKIIIMAAGGINNILLCFIMLMIYFGSIVAPKANIAKDSIAYNAIGEEYIEIEKVTYRFYETESGRVEDEEGKRTHLQGSITYSDDFKAYDEINYMYDYGHEYIFERMQEDGIKNKDFNTLSMTEEIILYIEGFDNPTTLSKTFNIVVNTENNGLAYEGIESYGISCANKKYTFFENMSISFKQEVYAAGLIYRALGQLITNIKGSFNNLGGIVQMYDISKTYAQEGFSYYVLFLASISVNLGIMNLLPFPALDGGKIVLTIIEAITKKKTNAKVEGIINLVGFSLLMLLMVFVTLKDLGLLNWLVG